eukprot:gene16091-19148_t
MPISLRSLHNSLDWSQDNISPTHILGESLPPSLTHYRTHNIIYPEKYPHSITSLTVTNTFTGTLTLDKLPPFLKHLDIRPVQPLTARCLPDTLESLHIGGSLPTQLIHLDLGMVNHEIKEGDLPQGLNMMATRGHDPTFNRPIIPHSLPPSLQHLVFGLGFGSAIAPFSLPSTLTHLELGHLSDGYLPDTLTNLKFSPSYLYIPQPLPSSLTHLTIGIFTSSDTIQYPSTLTHLTIELESDSMNTIQHLPTTLTHLFIDASAEIKQLIIPKGSLPESLKRMDLNFCHFAAVLFHHRSAPPTLELSEHSYASLKRIPEHKRKGHSNLEDSMGLNRTASVNDAWMKDERPFNLNVPIYPKFI